MPPNIFPFPCLEMLPRKHCGCPRGEFVFCDCWRARAVMAVVVVIVGRLLVLDFLRR